jgi:MraZ protein
MDATSRVLIHPELRTWALLEKDVKLIGMGSHFELWAAPAYAAYEARVMQAEASAALDNLKF